MSRCLGGESLRPQRDLHERVGQPIAVRRLEAIAVKQQNGQQNVGVRKLLRILPLGERGQSDECVGMK